MKSYSTVLFGLALITPVLLSAEKKPQNQDPVVWGILSNNSGCVLFAEGHQTKGMFYGVAVTTQTVGKLTLIETQNYAFAEQITLETQEKTTSSSSRFPRSIRPTCSKKPGQPASNRSISHRGAVHRWQTPGMHPSS
jgi:hypothetical protein